uniref:UV-stimulated scaffold protein A C-terminal domain-containing protein n=1 Tax=Amblyomma maculatum TaxID=34609 RepID=G3MLP6_AMBMU
MAQKNKRNCESEILRVIKALTSSNPERVKRECMVKLKRLCRSSDALVKEASVLLRERLEEDDADVRLSTLAVINELFVRSHLFRTLILEDFQRILELLVETNPDLPLPGTPAMSKDLKEKSWETIEKWNEKFGANYRVLSLAMNFLRCFKQKTQRAEQQQQPAWADRLLNEIADRTPDIQLIVTQMENCFRLLVPSEAEDEACKATIPSTAPLPGTSLAERLRDHAMPVTFRLEIQVSRKVNVCKTADNEEVLDTVRRLHQELMEISFPMVKKWLKGLAKITHPMETLRNTIDLKHRIEIAHEKFEELNVGSEDSSDSELEEVPEKEGYEPVIPTSRQTEYGVGPAEKRSEGNMVGKACRRKEPDEASDPTSRQAQLLRLRRELAIQDGFGGCGKSTNKIVPSAKDLEEAGPSTSCVAPVRNIDLDLIYWEQDKVEATVGSGFSDLNCVWKGTSKDDDDNVQAQALPFRERRIDFSGRFEPVKWACRAPLPSGKLCPRRDRFKCPLHGPVVARDDLGNPRDPSLAQPAPSLPDWQEPGLLRDLEAATGAQLKVGRPARQKKRGQCHTRGAARARLEKKVFNRQAAKRVAQSMNAVDGKKFRDKFSDQWNYALGT